MSKVRVTLTYLVEEVVEYNSNIALSTVERVMEDEFLFEEESLLIGKEIGLHNRTIVEIKDDKSYERTIISNPTIIKLEKA